MSKGYEVIKKNLYVDENEEIIYITDRNFKFGEKGTIIKGEKILCISNLGRIFICDKERKFKSLELYVYDNNGTFKVLTKNDIVAINSKDISDDRKKAFILNINMNDFINIYKKVDKSIFDINWEMYVVKNDSKYESAIIDLREESFCINTISYNQEREYKNITNYKLKSNLLIIEGYFPNYQKLEIYAFSKDLNYFIDIIESKINKVEDIKQDEENEVTGIYNFISKQKIQDKLEDEDAIGISKRIENYIKDEREILKEEKIYLSGFLNGINYERKLINLSIEDELIRIKNIDTKEEIVALNFNKFNFIKEDNILIVENQKLDLILLLEFGKDYNFEKLFNKIDISTNSSRYIAYNSELKPFCIDFYEKKLIFKHNNNLSLNDFILKDIVDVIIVDNGVYFDKISIIFRDSTDIKINLLKSKIDDFIKELYRKSKEEDFLNSNFINIAENFSYMLEERMEFLFLSEFTLIKRYLDSFSKKEIDDKNIVINIYKSLIRQDKINKSMAMAIPEFIGREINKVICSDDYYKCLDKLEIGLLKIARTIKNDIKENSDFMLSLEGILDKSRYIGTNNEVLEFDFKNILDILELKISVKNDLDLGSNVSDIELKYIINKFRDDFNYILDFRVSYYIKLINNVLSEFLKDIISLFNEQEKEGLKLQLFLRMSEFYLFKQSKSSLDFNIRRKVLIDEIKKYSKFKNKSYLIDSNIEYTFIDMITSKNSI
ncbi:hypothetical protein [Clostridium mediterraneense]|uniref:hypothetical protein n=1 Tax=Clostridium mediterraneense TaxID=1805472 RepID=UPI0008328288|nr:hypothetical protein [Clostridium mediterraneense]